LKKKARDFFGDIFDSAFCKPKLKFKMPFAIQSGFEKQILFQKTELVL